MNYTLITTGISEPVTLSETKTHLLVEHTEDDGYISDLIAAATQYVQNECDIQLMTSTWRLRLDTFKPEILLSRVPVISVTEITYLDPDGELQILDAAEYEVDTYSKPARIRPVDGNSWPSTDIAMNAVSITFTAGYGNAESVPRGIKQAILMLVGHWYEHREAAGPNSMTQTPLAVEPLLWQYRWTTNASY